MFTATSSSKRRKIEQCPLHDLLQGGGLLEEVANYLAPPSRIMFALAVTPPKSPYDTIMGRSRLSKTVSLSIAGRDWSTLDFGEIEKDLAARLSDDDMCAILVHIDAVRKVKRLKLTNCTKITGVGLRPLLFSTVIEQIDLSLVGLHQKPELDPEPPISFQLVVPILDSIISGAGASSLKHLQFPYKWRKYRSDNFEFHAFLDRFRNNSAAISCLVCSKNRGHPWIVAAEDEEYGTVYNMCCICTRLDCYNHNNRRVHFCNVCDRTYCTECTTMVPCGGGCEQYFCSDCKPNNCANSSCTEILCDECAIGDCQECNKSWCMTCWEDVDRITRCDGCRETACCGECSQKEEVNGVHICEGCDEVRCDNCRITECHLGNNNCRFCMKMVAPQLLELTMEQNQQLKNEVADLNGKNELLRVENGNLHSRNESLHSKNIELRDKLSVIRVIAS